MAEDNSTQLRKKIKSDLNNPNSFMGSKNVYVLTHIQTESSVGKKNPGVGCSDVLRRASRRTPFTDYANEWFSEATNNAKTFLVKVFDTIANNSRSTGKLSIEFIRDNNWSIYEEENNKLKSEIRLVD